MGIVRKLIDGHVWSEVGDVVKFVVRQKDLLAMMEMEREMLRKAYEAGWLDGHKGEGLMFDEYFKNKYGE